MAKNAAEIKDLINKVDSIKELNFSAPRDDKTGLVESSAYAHLEGLDLTQVDNIELVVTDSKEVQKKALHSLLGGVSVWMVHPGMSSTTCKVTNTFMQTKGAPGCTGEGFGFETLYQEFKNSGISEIYAVSTKSSEQQHRVAKGDNAKSKNVSFKFISDHLFMLAKLLRLPVSKIEEVIFLERVTFIVGANGKIAKVFYGIEKPADHAVAVLQYVTQNQEALKANPYKPDQKGNAFSMPTSGSSHLQGRNQSIGTERPNPSAQQEVDVNADNSMLYSQTRSTL